MGRLQLLAVGVAFFAFQGAPLPALAQPDQGTARVNQHTSNEIQRLREEQAAERRRAEERYREAEARNQQLSSRVDQLTTMLTAYFERGAESGVGAGEARFIAASIVIDGGEAGQRAATQIASGNVEAASNTLYQRAASDTTRQNADEWRRIGALARYADVRRAIDAYERAVAIDSSDIDSLLILSELRADAGNLAGARDALNEAERRQPTVEQAVQLGWRRYRVNYDSGDEQLAADSGRAYHAAAADWLQLEPRNETARIQYSRSFRVLGYLASDAGEIQNAIPHFERALTELEGERSAEARFNSIIAGVWLTDMYTSIDNYAEARRVSDRNVTRVQQARRAFPDDRRFLQKFGEVQWKVGYLEGESGRPAQARAAFNAAIAAYRELLAVDPNNGSWRGDLATSLASLAYFEQEEGSVETARRLMTEALAERRRVAALDPNNIQWASALIGALRTAAGSAGSAGDYRGARAFAQEALTLTRARAATPGSGVAGQLSLLNSLGYYAGYASAAGDTAGAVASRDEAINIATTASRTNPNNTDLTYQLCFALRAGADTNYDAGNQARARELSQRAVACSRPLAAARPTLGQVELAHALQGQVRIFGYDSRAPNDSEAALNEALQIRQRLADERPNDRSRAYDVLYALRQTCYMHTRRQRYEEAVACAEDGTQRANRLLTADPTNLNYLNEVDGMAHMLGTAYYEQGNYARATESYRERVGVIRRQLEISGEQEFTLNGLANALLNLGDARRRMPGQNAASAEEVTGYYLEALRITERLAEGDPANSNYQHRLLTALELVAMMRNNDPVYLGRLIERAEDLERRGILDQTGQRRLQRARAAYRPPAGSPT